MKLKEITINRFKAVPLYYQISESIERYIREAKLKPGTKLLSEEKIANLFKVSRPTVNKALNLLIKKLVVYRNGREGVFVKDNRKFKLLFLREDVSFEKIFKRQNIPFETKILEAKKIRADETLASELDVRKGDFLIYLKRVRLVNEEPILIMESHLLYKLFSKLLEKDLTKSLYGLLKEHCEVSITKTSHFIGAIKATEKDADTFGIPLGSSLIVVEGVAYSSDGKKVDYYKSKLRGDKVALVQCYKNIRNETLHSLFS